MPPKLVSNEPPALVPIMAVGISDIPGPVAYLEKKTIAYVSGRMVVTTSLDSSVQGKISEPCAQVRNIGAMAVSPDRQHVAVAEFMSGGLPSQITMISVADNLARVVSLKGPDVFKYVHVCFSGDCKFVAAVGYDEEMSRSIFHVWEWQAKAEPSSSGEAIDSRGVVRISMHPKFTTNLVTQSPDSICLWRLGASGYRKQAIKGLIREGTTVFVDHCWMSDGRMVVANSQRQIYVVEASEVVQVSVVGGPIICLLPLPGSCIAVAMQKGQIHIFKCLRESNTLELQGVLQAPDSPGAAQAGQDVTFMSLSEDGTRAACYNKSGPVSICNFEYGVSTALSKEDIAESWEEILPALHSGAIVSASLASAKDFIATASGDLTVRVWQYNPLRLIVTHFCHHNVLALGIDPWGREMIICYADSTRVYNVVEGMLMELGSLMADRNGLDSGHPRYNPEQLCKCSMVKYNPTGHLIALVGGGVGFSDSDGNNKDIFIFATLSKRQLAVLKGHFTPVLDLTWSVDGLYLCSTSDNCVYTWQMETFTKKQESASKSFLNTSVTCNSNFSTIVVGHSGQGLRMLHTDRMKASPSLPEKPADAGTTATATDKAGRIHKIEAVPPFRVPGTSHSAAPIHDLGAPLSTKTPNAGTGRLKAAVQAVVKIDALGLANKKVSSAYSGTSQPPKGVRKVGQDELSVHSHYNNIAQPTGLAMAETADYKCVIAADVEIGYVRVLNIEPRNDEDYDEYLPHVSAITQVLAHPKGRLVFTTDTSGFWNMYILVPRETIYAGLGNKEQTLGNVHGASDVTFADMFSIAKKLLAKEVQSTVAKDGGTSVVSIRDVDIHSMKDSIRELKDRLNKAATTNEYKMYEREQAVRRETDGDLNKWKLEYQACRKELMEMKESMQRTAVKAAEREVEMKEVHKASLMEERSQSEIKIAYEINRTNNAEKEIQRLKGKFGKKVWEVEEENRSVRTEAKKKEVTMSHAVEHIKAQTCVEIEKNKQHMDLEIGLDSEMNEEELVRAGQLAGEEITAWEEKFNELQKKHTLQTGLSHKTAQQNKMLKKSNDQLTKENEHLSECVVGLTEELEAMHLAWSERDARQRSQDAEMKELMHRMQQGQLYTTVATNRIKELSAEMEPLKASKAKVHEDMIKMEGVQLRITEQQHKSTMDYGNLHERFENAQEALKNNRQDMKTKDAYFDNFLTQLFRIIHGVDLNKWPSLLGKLHADFSSGKDRSDWSRYILDAGGKPPPKGMKAVEAASALGGVAEEAAPQPVTPKKKPEENAEATASAERARKSMMMTQQEWQSQIEELQCHVRHAEKVIANMKDSRERTESGQKAVIQKLVADNSVVLAESNALKRTNKDLREQLDRQGVDIHSLRNDLSRGKWGASGAGTPSSRLSRAASMVAAAAAAGTSSDGTAGVPMSSQEMAAAAAASRAASSDGSRDNSSPARGTGPASGIGSGSGRPPVAMRGSGNNQPLGGWTKPSSGAEEERGSGPYHRRSSNEDLSTGVGAPHKVTGEMPKGGWWMGDSSPFNQGGGGDGGVGIFRGEVAGEGRGPSPGGSIVTRRPVTSDGVVKRKGSSSRPSTVPALPLHQMQNVRASAPTSSSSSPHRPATLTASVDGGVSKSWSALGATEPMPEAGDMFPNVIEEGDEDEPEDEDEDKPEPSSRARRSVSASDASRESPANAHLASRPHTVSSTMINALTAQVNQTALSQRRLTTLGAGFRNFRTRNPSQRQRY